MKEYFRDIGSFMIRTPSFPIDLLLNHIGQIDDMDSMMSLFGIPDYKQQFDEAILAASYDLYEAVKHYSKQDATTKDTEYLLNSLYKYFSRNCTRCTPFGLFSTVSFGEITGERTEFVLKTDEIKREPQADTTWLFEVVYQYEKEYRKILRYSMNEAAASYRNKVFLFNCTKGEDGEKLNKKTINRTKAFEVVLSCTDDFAAYDAIIEKLREAYPDVDETVFHTYVQSLIQEGYLVSDLRPPLTIDHQLKYFIGKLKEYGISADAFEKIDKLITEYADVSRADGGRQLKEICRSMEEIKSAKSYLALDSSFDYKACHMNRNEIKRINKFMNLFLQFNARDSYDRLEDYKNKFLGKYGVSRCVPLVELIDSDTGIGFPGQYEGESTGKNAGIGNPWVAFFEKKYVEAVKSGRGIEITDADIEKLQTEEFVESRLPGSLEVYFNYFKENGKDTFLLSNIFGSTGAGKSFGRFSHFMSEPEKFYRQIDSVYGKEGECEFCEFVFLPDSLSSANVIRNMHGSGYEVSFGTTNSKGNAFRLKLEDILVGISDGKYYLKSASHNKRIIPTSTNMFNPQLKPQVLRLIDEMASDSIRFFNKPWEAIQEKFGYMPSVRYKNFILEEEKWALELSDIELTKKSSFPEFKKKMQQFRDQMGLPDWVNYVDADKKLLLNLNEDRCLAVLQKFMEKSRVILERYDVSVEHPVKFGEHSYCCEVVVPLVLTEQMPSVKDVVVDTNEQYKGSGRFQKPLEEWLYFKLYGVKENAEYLLGEALPEILHGFRTRGEIDSYFFIQYKDPEQHLRLRVKADRQRLTEALPKFLEIFNRMMEDSLISNYCIDCYELEAERYGGEKLMDFAHEVFYKDSASVMRIIHEKNDGSIAVSDEFLALAIILYHMIHFKLSLNEMFAFLDCADQKKQYQEEFKKNRDSYMDFAVSYFTGSGIPKELQHVLDLLAVKDSAMERYGDKITELYPNRPQVKMDILDSLLHMNMNRLFGPRVDYERKVRGIARQVFYNVYNKNKKTGILQGGMNA